MNIYCPMIFSNPKATWNDKLCKADECAWWWDDKDWSPEFAGCCVLVRITHFAEEINVSIQNLRED